MCVVKNLPLLQKKRAKEMRKKRDNMPKKLKTFVAITASRGKLHFKKEEKFKTQKKFKFNHEVRMLQYVFFFLSTFLPF